MALLAVVVGIGVVIWLNGQSSPGSGEIRRAAERPVLGNPREAIAVGEAKRAAAAREQARLRKMRAARRDARRRAAIAAAAARRSEFARGQFGQQNGYPASQGNYQYGTPGYSTGTQTQTYTQQAQPQQQSSPAPRPKPQPKRSSGGGGVFDDSG